MLKICEDFAKEFCVVFNTSKCVCLQMSTVASGASFSVDDLKFKLDGSSLSFVDNRQANCSRLSHLLSSSLDDKFHIMSVKA